MPPIQIQTQVNIFSVDSNIQISGLLQMLTSRTTPKQRKSQRGNYILTPEQIPLKQQCHKIVAGALHSYAISKNGVYLWGKNMRYKIKEDSRSSSIYENDEDKIVQLPINVDNLATGPNHTFAWNDKQVYCWGSNENYQLGLQEEKNYGCDKIQIFEEAMINGYHLQQIQCGQSHTLAIFRVPQFERQQELFPNSPSQITQKEEDNEQQGIQMFAWGKSESYQLTINSINIIPYPVLAPCSFKHLTSVHSKSDYNAALCNHKVYTWGANLFSRLGNVQSKVRIPQQVPLLKKIIKVSLGNHHVVAVSMDGQAYSWGKGDLGQLGIDRFQTQSRPNKMICEERIIDAACGDLHTLVRSQNNILRSCGGNKNGALGHSHYDSSDKKKRCKRLQKVENQQIIGPICMIACGNHHNLVLNNSGVVFGWGNNDYYQVFPNSIRKQDKQEIVRRPKKSLQIIVDEQITTKLTRQQEEGPKISLSGYLQKLQSWKNKYELFRQQKARQEQLLIKQYEQIINGLKNVSRI